MCRDREREIATKKKHQQIPCNTQNGAVELRWRALLVDICAAIFALSCSSTTNTINFILPKRDYKSATFNSRYLLVLPPQCLVLLRQVTNFHFQLVGVSLHCTDNKRRERKGEIKRDGEEDACFLALDRAADSLFLIILLLRPSSEPGSRSCCGGHRFLLLHKTDNAEEGEQEEEQVEEVEEEEWFSFKGIIVFKNWESVPELRLRMVAGGGGASCTEPEMGPVVLGRKSLKWEIVRPEGTCRWK